MNVRLLGLVAAMSALGLVACGDDTGGGTGGAGTGGGGTGGSTTASTTTASGTGGEAGTGGAAGTGGDAGTGGAAGTGGGGTAPECADECADDVGCDENPANPSGACSECVAAEGAKGTASPCAVEGALGDCCQDDADCSAYVTCVLAGTATCDEDEPEGSAIAAECVLQSCGNCGDGPG